MSVRNVRDEYPCCICPKGCQGLDGDPECSFYCSICIHGCPAMDPESCCRERLRLGRLLPNEIRNRELDRQGS